MRPLRMPMKPCHHHRNFCDAMWVECMPGEYPSHRQHWRWLPVAAFYTTLIYLQLAVNMEFGDLSESRRRA